MFCTFSDCSYLCIIRFMVVKSADIKHHKSIDPEKEKCSFLMEKRRRSGLSMKGGGDLALLLVSSPDPERDRPVGERPAVHRLSDHIFTP